MQSAQGSMTQIALQAQTTFHRNSDTLIAGFLVRNPTVRPEDVELVMIANREGMKFRIDPKELYVPPAREHGTGFDEDEVIAWNECRAEMIRLARAARPQDALVSTLANTLVEPANG